MDKLLLQVLEKYKFMHPLSPGDQKSMPKVKNRILKQILSQKNRRSFLDSLVLALFHQFQKITASPSMQFSRAIVYSFTATCLLFIIGGTSFLLLHNNMNNNGFIYYSKGKAYILHNKSTEIASIKKSISENSTIRTESKSELTLQINKIGTIRFLPETIATIATFNSSLKTAAIHLHKGSIFSNIISGGSISYKIDTPDCTILVKGTKFNVSYNTLISKIKIIEGTVEIITHKDPVNKIILPKGQKVLITKTSLPEITPLTNFEKLELTKMALHEYVENFNTMSISTINKHFDKIDKKEQKINKKVDSINKLRKNQTQSNNFQHADSVVIILKNNYKFTGKLIQQKGDFIIIETNSGLKQVVLSEIKTISTNDNDQKERTTHNLRKKETRLSLIHLRNNTTLVGTIIKQDNTYIHIDLGDNIIKVPTNEIIRKEPLH